MNLQQDYTLTAILDQLFQMHENGETKASLFSELKEEYHGKIKDDAVTGTEAREASDWWVDHGNFGGFNKEKEQDRLLKLTASNDYSISD